MPNVKSPISEAFLFNFHSAYSLDHLESNNEKLNKIVSDPNTILYLLEKIKEVLCDGNFQFMNEIPIIFAFLKKIIDLKSQIIQQTPDLAQLIL